MLHEKGIRFAFRNYTLTRVVYRLVSLQELEEAMRPDTSIVSIMAVNNEIGGMQPIAEIGELCRSRGVFFHTDAAQSVVNVTLTVNAMKIDIMSNSGHKIYGPKGIGAIYIRRRPRVRIEPMMNGGGQERGLRSGTMPTHLIVGLGEACAIAEREMEADKAHIERLSKKLYDVRLWYDTSCRLLVAD